MTEKQTNPAKYPKIIERASDGSGLRMSEATGEVIFTSEWEDVHGGEGVKCRTWIIKGADGVNIDGGDVGIEAGGWTPIQLVQAAEIVVDAPEMGEGWVVAMDSDGEEVYVNYFDGSEPFQMNWTEGMIICWIAKSELELTEFESPAFNDEMFVTVPETVNEFRGRDISEMLRIVKALREEANQEQR